MNLEEHLINEQIKKEQIQDIEQQKHEYITQSQEYNWHTLIWEQKNRKELYK